jgi:hypothetical protein
LSGHKYHQVALACAVVCLLASSLGGCSKGKSSGFLSRCSPRGGAPSVEVCVEQEGSDVHISLTQKVPRWGKAPKRNILSWTVKRRVGSTREEIVDENSTIGRPEPRRPITRHWTIRLRTGSNDIQVIAHQEGVSASGADYSGFVSRGEIFRG